MTLTRILKIFGLAATAIFVLLVAAILTLFLFVDPRALAPEINRYLADYRLKVDFKGDISWQFYPRIGISMENTTVNTLTKDPQNPEAALIDIENFAAAVTLLPLLSGSIEVNAISLTGLRTSFIVDKEGNSVWQETLDRLSTESNSEPKPETTNTAAADNIKIDLLEIKAVELIYEDQRNGSAYQIDNLELIAKDLRLDNRPMNIDLSLTLSGNDIPKLQLAAENRIAVELQQQTLDILTSNIKVKPDISQAEIIALDSKGKLNWQNGITGDVFVNQKTVNPKRLLTQFGIAPPETKNTNALSQLSSQLELKLTADNYQLLIHDLTLDQSTIKGRLQLNTASNQTLDASSSLSLDKIVLDDYLPPQQKTTASQTSSTATPLPLDFIRSSTVTTEITIGNLVVQNQSLTDINLQAGIKNGNASIDSLAAQLGEGRLSARAKLNAKPRIPTLAGTFSTEALDAGQLLKNLADFTQLAGNIDSDINFTSQGTTDAALIDNIVIEARGTANQVSITPVNLEKYFCNAVDYLQQKDPTNNDVTWPEVTPIEKVETLMTYKNKIVELKGFNANVQQISTEAVGKLNLETGKFNFPFDLKLTDAAKGEEKCGGISEQWRNQAIPLVCSGNYNDIDFKTCRPDTARLSSMLSAAVKNAADEKINTEKAKAKAKVDAELRKKKEELERKKQEEKDKLLKKLNNLLN